MRIVRVLALLSIVLPLQSTFSAPRVNSGPEVSGIIRSWGNDQMGALMKLWENGFRQSHPDITFEDKLFGPASAMAGIYTGVADLSLMGHEIRKEESMAFEWVHQYKALGIEVATASLDRYSDGAALVVFVHKDNPVSELSLEQLDGIFGSEHRRGDRNIRKWGDLGLTGNWSDKPIHTYGYASETESGAFFRERVLKNSFKWNCDLDEFNDTQDPDGQTRDAGPRILEALRQDRYGIAFSKLLYGNESVKPVSIAETAGGAYFAPTRENTKSRTYPLFRAVMIYLNRVPGAPLDAKIGAFLRYVLSADGQHEIEHEGGYLPLSAKTVREQLQKLK